MINGYLYGTWPAQFPKCTKTTDMQKDALKQLTDEELLAAKKKAAKSRIFHALSIGFLAGILIFGFVSWVLSPEKRLGFLLPMLIPVVFIYRLLTSPNKHKALGEVLAERQLD